MDLQPSQNNYSEGDRLQTSESLSGFFSRMTVSNKTMERIMRQDSNLSLYDGFRIGGIGKVLNQIGLNQRKHHIIYKVSSGEFAIPMKFTGNVMEMLLIPKEEILEELSNLYVGKLMFDIHPRIAYNLADQDFSRVLTLHQDFKRKDLMKEAAFVGRYEGMLEIAGHEILVAGVAGRENGSMTLGLSFLEDHKPWGRKGNAYIDSGSGICTAKPGVFPKEERETLPVIARRDFSQKILILNTGIREAKIMIGGAFGTPWFRVKTPPIYFYDTGADILLVRYRFCEKKRQNRIMPINFRSKRGDFDAKLTHPKMQDKRKFGKVLLSFRQQGLIDSDSFHEESEEEIKNLKEALQELKTMDISEESKLSLENVKRLIQRNFSENPLAWWDRNKIEATLKIKEECKYEYVRYKPIQMNMEDKKDMQMIIKEHINLGLIEPGISAYSSPGFLEHIVEKIRNFPDILKDKKHLQSFLGVVNFAGIFIKDLAKYRKDFRPLLKETESAKWKWEEIYTQRVRELKQVCNNLPKLAIPQDEDELVVYTDANDYRWAAVLIKKTTTGEEPCRYTGGLFTEQQARVWHINEKEFFAVWKAFKKWPLFLLAKEFTLKVDNTNVKAFLKNKLESKIEKSQMEASEANSIMLRLRHLRENLEELNKKFGRLAVNSQVAGQIQRADLDTVQIAIRTTMVASTSLWNDLQEPIRKASSSEMTNESKKHDTKHALRVQDSRPVVADSSTAYTRPSPDSGVTATNESQGVQTSDDSSQPSAPGVKGEEISLRPMTDTFKVNTNELSSSSSAWQDYQRMWKS
ncbi:UNVERIFIED_CONTAM: Polyprotein P3 [Sesamum calycinum]|uniref:Polyprotein P3 n=1 Tax=Sesamum calycinum TaxID=2727403 RepID=A0AAW2N2E8_9LAMI